MNEYNRHLGRTPAYVLLDWQIIKAMLWTESGAAAAQWKIKPMQIGVLGDPGMMSLLGDKEGGDLVMPPALRARLTGGTIRTIPSHNIRGGIGYLLMRSATYAHITVRVPGTTVEEVKVKQRDNFDRIARNEHSTIATLRELNPGVNVLQKGQVVKTQQATVQKVITGWRPITSSHIYEVYNGRRDKNYVRKLDFSLGLVRKGRSGVCAP
ncbi:LysM peptidoglycan-binding domain-containing protein [Massilia genomosp. 1]|uniref:LysM peptidoglycan-binding domain-containing protein n=1 Tax=Massilia genomosp. 1 TaxID=2609280 RepID=UPI0035A399DD